MARYYGFAASESNPAERRFSSAAGSGEIMAVWPEGVGSLAAVCTTLCWLPQAVKIIREKKTGGISLITQSVFTLGTALWAVYGLLLNNRPIIYANGVTLGFALAILVLKLRYP
ncbi:MAG: SemiSWEET transporter [Candidatus Acidiferrales bacterium]